MVLCASLALASSHGPLTLTVQRWAGEPGVSESMATKSRLSVEIEEKENKGRRKMTDQIQSSCLYNVSMKSRVFGRVWLFSALGAFEGPRRSHLKLDCCGRDKVHPELNEAGRGWSKSMSFGVRAPEFES